MTDYILEVVVGIDFGTTHTGVSWAVNGGDKIVRLINNWPNPRAQNAAYDKVPSSISYLDGKPDKWGYTVETTDESLKWFKVLLEPNHKYTETVEPVKNSNTLLGKIKKTPQEVAADYLRQIWDYTKDEIRKYQGQDFEKVYALRVILTVPAVWSHAAKENSIQAALAAGMPSDIVLVTEPEAAALATLKDRETEAAALAKLKDGSKTAESTLSVGDAFVVCDAGGGTVDLISYEVLTLQPLVLRECAIGNGDLCGSVFLDLAFEKCVTTIVGEDQYYNRSGNRKGIKESNRKKMMEQFEFGIKRTFTGMPDQKFSVDLKGVEDDENEGILDDTILIQVPLLRAIFDNVWPKIEILVGQQISRVHERGLIVKAILLVGGFGESKYLFDRLAQCHKNAGIAVLKVTNAWSSICRGATLWGLDHSSTTSTLHRPTIASRLSRYSYGVRLDEPYDESKGHLPRDQFVDEETGVLGAKNQMKWFLKRGDEVIEGRVPPLPCHKNICIHRGDNERVFDMQLYHCMRDRPPTRKTGSVKPLCQVTYRVAANKLREHGVRYTHPRTKRNWWKCNFECYIGLDNATLDFQVKFHGETVGQVQAEYMDKFD